MLSAAGRDGHGGASLLPRTVQPVRFAKMIALLKTRSCANTAIQSIGSYVHSDDLMMSKSLGLSVEETLSSLVSPNSTRRLRTAQEPFPDGGVEAAVGGVPWAGSLHRGCSQE